MDSQQPIVTRSLMVLKIDSNNGAIRLNFQNGDAGHLRIVRVQVTGVTSSSWLWISFGGGISTLPVLTGSNNQNAFINSQQYPLPISIEIVGGNVSNYELQTPMCIMGADTLTSNNPLLEYKITDSNGLPAVFDTMTIVLDYVPCSQYNKVTGDRRISENIATTVTERRQNFNPGNLAFDHTLRLHKGY